jgi:hypothetical protein
LIAPSGISLSGDTTLFACRHAVTMGDAWRVGT